jgi:hypothetical protein
MQMESFDGLNSSAENKFTVDENGEPITSINFIKE